MAKEQKLIERDTVSEIHDCLTKFDNLELQSKELDDFDSLDNKSKSSIRTDIETKKQECLTTAMKYLKWLIAEKKIPDPVAFKDTDTQIRKIKER